MGAESYSVQTILLTPFKTKYPLFYGLGYLSGSYGKTWTHYLRGLAGFGILSVVSTLAGRLRFCGAGASRAVQTGYKLGDGSAGTRRSENNPLLI
jgi:hypothetical protein